MRKAFTLIEVNLAIMVMAGGILAILGLYSLGYRENRQSREDVAASAYADAVMSPLVMACSATNVKWTVFKELPSYPSEEGWTEYFNQTTGNVESNPESRAKSVFASVLSKLQGGAKGSLDVSTQWPSTASGGLKAGLVVLHEKESAIVRIGFRATRHASELLSMPLFYTEVRFQGIADE